jgi:hypothetical protein
MVMTSDAVEHVATPALDGDDAGDAGLVAGVVGGAALLCAGLALGDADALADVPA